MKFKIYATKIRESVAIRESWVEMKSIFAYAPQSSAAVDYNSLFDEILKEDKKHE